MLRDLDQLRFLPQTVLEIEKQKPNIDFIDVPGREVVVSIFRPEGIEMRPVLDPEHMPRVTRFNTVIVSWTFASLRGELPEMNSAYEVGGNPKYLRTISTTARDGRGYDITNGVRERKEYLEAMVVSAGGIYQVKPLRENDVVVPVLRCGGNIAGGLGINGVPIEVKRLRFNGMPDLLGAGVNINSGTAECLSGKRVRLLEGVVASGSTVSVVAMALRNLGVSVEAIDCDAVIVTPVGANFSKDFRQALGIKGEERGAFVGGILNPNWYVVYSPQSRELRGLPRREWWHLRSERWSAKLI